MKIDTNGDLVFYYTQDEFGRGQMKWYYPAKHVQMIKQNMLKGMPYWLASPIYPIERHVAAFILANA